MNMRKFAVALAIVIFSSAFVTSAYALTVSDIVNLINIVASPRAATGYYATGTFTLSVYTRIDVLDQPIDNVLITVDGVSKSSVNGLANFSLSPGVHTISVDGYVNGRPFTHFWDVDYDNNCDNAAAGYNDTANNPHTFTTGSCDRMIFAWYKVFTTFKNAAGANASIDYDGTKISGKLLMENGQPLGFSYKSYTPTVSLLYYDGNSWITVGSTSVSTDGTFSYSWTAPRDAIFVGAQFNSPSWYFVNAFGTVPITGTCVSSCRTTINGEKSCGDDGCGGSCGTCPTGQTCSNGLCSSNQTCTDSDGGINYNVRGTTSGYYNGTFITATDSCLLAPNLGAGTTNQSQYLGELYCSGNNLVPIVYTCPNGCQDGACVQSGNQTCTDSDGGKNYYTKGNVTVCTYGVQSGGCGLLSDNCVGNTLQEGYCDGNNNRVDSYVCPNGCSNGACISNQTCPSLMANDVCPSNCNGTCYCGSGPTAQYCSPGLKCCFNTILSNPNTWACGDCPTTSCTDSDGLNYYNKGYVDWNGVRDYDFCDGNYVMELFCNNTDQYPEHSVGFLCPNGCQDGACVSASNDKTTLDKYPNFMFDNNERLDVIIVVNQRSDAPEENIGYNIANDFYPKPPVRFDYAITPVDQTHNLILVGGPCTNSLVEKLAEAGKFPYTCASWPGRDFGLIQIIDDAFTSGKAAIVLSGTRSLDTLLAGMILQNYKLSLKYATSKFVELTFQMQSQ